MSNLPQNMEPEVLVLACIILYSPSHFFHCNSHIIFSVYKKESTKGLIQPRHKVTQNRNNLIDSKVIPYETNSMR